MQFGNKHSNKTLYTFKVHKAILLCILAILVIPLLGCSSEHNELDDSLPGQLGDHIMVSGSLDLSESTFPVFTAEIGMEDIQKYVDTFFQEPQNASVTVWEDGTYAVRSPSDRMYMHPALSAEYYLIDDTLENPMIFYNYSLLFSSLNSMNGNDYVLPSGAHYSYLPDSLQNDNDLPFQALTDAQNYLDNKMRMIEGYDEGAYRAETVTSDALRDIYDHLDLSAAVEADPLLTITDEWLKSACGYRFFYAMNVNGVPIYSDNGILKSKTTADGMQIICPSAEVMTTEEGIIYAYVRSPIWNISESDEIVSRVGLKEAGETVAEYFDDMIITEGNSIDIYSITLEYAACRNEEKVTLQPVYAFYYSQGGNIGCLLINAQNGELL